MATRDSAFGGVLNKCAQFEGNGATDESANQDTISQHCC